MRPRLRLGWACLSGHTHDTEAAAQACIDAHVRQQRTDPYAADSAPSAEDVAHRELVMRHHAVTRYRVHEAGAVEPDGSQACGQCGHRLLPPAPADARRDLWGYPVGRRVAEMPLSGALYLVAPDRQLAPDEVPCRG